jgi:hypothetical protein
MFGNRGYGFKVAAAFAAAGALAGLANLRGMPLKPAASFCVSDPEDWDGTELWLSGTVASVRDAGRFVLDPGNAGLEVRGAADVEVGQAVSVAGIFRAEGGPHLELRRLRTAPPRPWLRRIPETVSVLVLAAVLFNFHRRFSIRRDALTVGGR